MVRDYTTGNMLRAIASLSVPIVLANMLQSAYQIVDTFWVGRLGADAVAAVSLSFPVLFLFLSLGAGLAVGGSVLVAQSLGRKDKKGVEHFATQATISVLAVSVVFAIIGYFLSGAAMRLLGASAAVWPLATQYLQISFIGMPFLFGYFIYMSVTRGVGEVRIPLLIVLSTVLLDLVLDPLFIYGWWFIPASGVAGAAWASVGTQLVSMILGFTLLLRGTHGVRLHWRDAKPDKEAQQRILQIGFPQSINQSSRAAGLLIMAGLVAALGTEVIAAYGIGIRIFSFIIIPAAGMAIATQTLVGQNIGAGKPDRAEQAVKLSGWISALILTGVGALVFLFARPLAAFFIPNDAQVIAMSAQFLRIMSWSFGLFAVQFAIAGGFRGTGHTVKALVITLISLFLVQIPVAYILSNFTSLKEVGFWISIPAANVVGAVVGVLWFRTGSWRKPAKGSVARRQ